MIKVWRKVARGTTPTTARRQQPDDVVEASFVFEVDEADGLDGIPFANLISLTSGTSNTYLWELFEALPAQESPEFLPKLEHFCELFAKDIAHTLNSRVLKLDKTPTPRQLITSRVLRTEEECRVTIRGGSLRFNGVSVAHPPRVVLFLVRSFLDVPFADKLHSFDVARPLSQFLPEFPISLLTCVCLLSRFGYDRLHLCSRKILEHFASIADAAAVQLTGLCGTSLSESGSEESATSADFLVMLMQMFVQVVAENAQLAAHGAMLLEHPQSQSPSQLVHSVLGCVVSCYGVRTHILRYSRLHKLETEQQDLQQDLQHSQQVSAMLSELRVSSASSAVVGLLCGVCEMCGFVLGRDLLSPLAFHTVAGPDIVLQAGSFVTENIEDSSAIELIINVMSVLFEFVRDEAENVVDLVESQRFADCLVTCLLQFHTRAHHNLPFPATTSTTTLSTPEISSVATLPSSLLSSSSSSCSTNNNTTPLLSLTESCSFPPPPTPENEISSTDYSSTRGAHSNALSVGAVSVVDVAVGSVEQVFAFLRLMWARVLKLVLLENTALGFRLSSRFVMILTTTLTNVTPTDNTQHAFTICIIWRHTLFTIREMLKSQPTIVARALRLPPALVWPKLFNLAHQLGINAANDPNSVYNVWRELLGLAELSAVVPEQSGAENANENSQAEPNASELSVACSYLLKLLSEADFSATVTNGLTVAQLSCFLRRICGKVPPAMFSTPCVEQTQPQQQRQQQQQEIWTPLKAIAEAARLCVVHYSRLESVEATIWLAARTHTLGLFFDLCEFHFARVYLLDDDDTFRVLVDFVTQPLLFNLALNTLSQVIRVCEQATSCQSISLNHVMHAISIAQQQVQTDASKHPLLIGLISSITNALKPLPPHSIALQNSLSQCGVVVMLMNVLIAVPHLPLELGMNVCDHVLEALFWLLTRNPSARQCLFQQMSGKVLSRLIGNCDGGRLKPALLNRLLDLLVDTEQETRSTAPVLTIQNNLIATVIFDLCGNGNNDVTTIGNVFEIFIDLCESSTHNRNVLVEIGALDKTLSLFTFINDNPTEQMKAIRLMKILGSHSIRVEELHKYLEVIGGRTREEGEVVKGQCHPLAFPLLTAMCDMAKRVGPSAYFNFSGSNSCITLPKGENQWPSTRCHTFCTWLRVEHIADPNLNTAAQNHKPRVISVVDTQSRQGFELFFNTQAKTLAYVSRSNQPLQTSSLNFNLRLRQGNWHHVCLVHNRSKNREDMEVILYVDGKRAGFGLAKTPFFGPGSNTVALIGSNAVGDTTHSHSNFANIKAAEEHYARSRVNLQPGPAAKSMLGPFARRNSPLTITRETNHTACDSAEFEHCFRGQMGTLLFFDDALTDAQVNGMFCLGANALSTFSRAEGKNSRAFKDAIDPLFDGTVGSKLAMLFSSKTCVGCECIDQSPSAPFGRVAELSHSVRSCVTQSVKDVVHCLGGIKVMFPLIPQLGDQSVSCSEETGSPVGEVLRVMCELLRDAPTNQSYMLRCDGFGVCGHLMQQLVSPCVAHSAVVKAVTSLMSCVSNQEALLSDCFHGLLANHRIWQNAPYVIQGEVLGCFDELAGKRSSLLTAQMLMDILSDVWSLASPGHLSRENILALRQRVIGTLRQVVETQTDDDLQSSVGSIVAFVLSCDVPEQLFDVLDFLASLCQSHQVVVALVNVLVNDNTDALLSLLHPLQIAARAAIAVSSTDQQACADDENLHLLASLRLSTLRIANALTANSYTVKASARIAVNNLDDSQATTLAWPLLVALNNLILQWHTHMSVAEVGILINTSVGALVPEGSVSDVFSAKCREQLLRGAIIVPDLFLTAIQCSAVSLLTEERLCVLDTISQMLIDRHTVTLDAKAQSSVLCRPLPRSNAEILFNQQGWQQHLIDNIDHTALPSDATTELVLRKVIVIFKTVHRSCLTNENGYRIVVTSLNALWAKLKENEELSSDAIQSLLVDLFEEAVSILQSTHPSQTYLTNVSLLLCVAISFVYGGVFFSGEVNTSVARAADGSWRFWRLAKLIVETCVVGQIVPAPGHVASTLALTPTLTPAEAMSVCPSQRYHLWAVSLLLKQAIDDSTLQHESLHMFLRIAETLCSDNNQFKLNARIARALQNAHTMFSQNVLLSRVGKGNTNSGQDQADGIGLAPEVAHSVLARALLAWALEALASASSQKAIQQLASIAHTLVSTPQGRTLLGGAAAFIPESVCATPALLANHVRSQPPTGEWQDIKTSNLFPSAEQIKLVETTHHSQCCSMMMVPAATNSSKSPVNLAVHSARLVEMVREQTAVWAASEERRKAEAVAARAEYDDLMRKKWSHVLRSVKEWGPWEDQPPADKIFWKVDKTEGKYRARKKLRRNYHPTVHRPIASSDVPKATNDAPKIEGLDIQTFEKMDEEELNQQDAEDSSAPKPADKKQAILFETTCRLVKVTRAFEGTFRVTPTQIRFLENSDDTGEGKIKRKVWWIKDVKKIYARRYMMRRTAFEIFFANGTNFFFNFPNKDHQKVFTKIRTASAALFGGRSPIPTETMRSPQTLFKAYRDVTEKWCERAISNFEYLMILNTISGRSFNDISQYPVFPWVIQDYTSEKLDLNRRETFRDLTKPIGVVSQSKAKNVAERYDSFEPIDNTPKFHHGSHYSSAGIVLFFMVRVEPFASAAVELQGGHFDHADRMFHTLSTTWDNVMIHSADNKELIPEFFYFPEMFINTNKFDFGTSQRGVKMEDCVLPPWCKNDPFEFVRLQREALESEYVSQHLHHWIDLIFGFKQLGRAAVKALNVFHYLSYQGTVDIDKISDPMMKSSVERQIEHFGQTPPQLLTREHPRRKAIETFRPGLFDRVKTVRRSSTYARVFADRNYNGVDFAEGSVMGNIYHDFSFTAKICTSSDGCIVSRTSSPKEQDQGIEEGIIVFVADEKLCVKLGLQPDPAVVIGNSRIADGKFHHIAVTYDWKRSQLSLFVDGKNDGKVSVAWPPERNVHSEMAETAATAMSSSAAEITTEKDDDFFDDSGDVMLGCTGHVLFHNGFDLQVGNFFGSIHDPLWHYRCLKRTYVEDMCSKYESMPLFDGDSDASPLVFLHATSDRVFSVNCNRILTVHDWTLAPQNVTGVPFNFRQNSTSSANNRKLIGHGFDISYRAVSSRRDLAMFGQLFAITGDGKHLVSGGNWNNSFVVTKLMDQSVVACVTQHQDIVTCVSVTGKDTVLVTGSRDTTLMVWVEEAGIGAGTFERPRSVLYGHFKAVSCVVANADLDVVVSGSLDGRCVIHNLHNGRFVRALSRQNPAPVHLLAVGECGTIVVFSNDDCKLCTYTINGFALRCVELDERLNCLYITPTDHILTGGEKSTMEVRNLHSLELLNRFPTPNPIAALTVTPNPTHPLLGHKNGAMSTFSLQKSVLAKFHAASALQLLV